MRVVRLTWGEINMGGIVATGRRVINIREGKPDRHGLDLGPCMGADIDWQGIIGEIAACRLLDRYWKPLEPGVVDASVAQVRSVDNENKRLIVHDHEADHLPFILALVQRDLLPDVPLLGWIMGRDAKRKEWLKDPTGQNRPAYFVPTSALLPMDALLEQLKRMVAA